MEPAGDRRGQTLAAIGVALGIFLAALDSTIVATAAPTMIASLGGMELYSWIFAAYMLASTTAAPLFGKLSDQFGRRRIFLIAILIFLISSFLAGTAATMPQLIVLRAFQGLGAGGIIATAFTIIGLLYSVEDRPRIQGTVGSVWAIASIVGPALGGLIVDHASWRWVFYVNVPIGGVPILLILRFFHEQPTSSTSRPVDLLGALTLTGSVLALLLGLLEVGNTNRWLAPATLSLFGASLGLLAVFLWIEQRVAEPLVPLSLFRSRVFAMANANNFLAGAALFGTTSFIPLFVQGVLGQSATIAGSTLLPSSLCWSLGSIISGQLVRRLGYRTLMTAGMAIMALGFVLLTRVQPTTSPLIIAAIVGMLGSGMGAVAPIALAAIQIDVPPSQLGIATSSAQFFRSIGGTLAVSVMGSVLAGRLSAELAMLRQSGRLVGLETVTTADIQQLIDPALGAALPLETLASLRLALSDAVLSIFVLGLGLALIGVVVATRMPAWSLAEASQRAAARHAAITGPRASE